MEQAKGINKSIKVLIVLGIIIAVIAAVLVVMQLNRPYAITVDGENILLVEDKDTGEAVIEKLMTSYQPEGTKLKNLTTDKELGFDIIKLWEDYDEDSIMTRKEAVAFLTAENADGDPLFTTTIKGRTKVVEEYIPEIEYKKDDEMFAGEARVEVEGVAGTQKVTYEITTVNGEETGKEAVDSKVLEEGTAPVIYKGTMGLPEGEDWRTYEGDPVLHNGDEMSKYALKYLGAPYKYGGYSLTDGIDCVQFVRAMYAKYGIKLPNNHKGLQNVGKGVSLGNAKPGDIVCYNHHVAIYLGDGKIVHSARGGGFNGVKTSNVNFMKIKTIRHVID
ncbi:MAG: NlpC/P60 family protein [Bacillota bacterium]|nr:NlpC/P60 family protein [Bacillota bacterium]